MKFLTNLNQKQKIYAGVIFLLILFYGIRFFHIDTSSFPTSSRIRQEERKIKQWKIKLENVRKGKEQKSKFKEKIKASTSVFWSAKKGKNTTNQVQLTIEKLGRMANTNLTKVGAPRVSDVSENIQAIDISVSTTTSIKSLTEFLRRVENHSPKLIWNQCVIRPNQTRTPTSVVLSGKIRAYIVAKDATAYLEESN